MGTLAVDAHWRLYFDPEYLASASADEAELVILHEVSHLLLKHHARGSNVSDWELWNVATDCAINHRLQAEGHQVPADWLLPERLQLPANQTTEQFYRALIDRKRPAGPAANDAGATEGSPGAGDGHSPTSDTTEVGTQAKPSYEAVAPGTSGSCADGRQRPWEDPAPASDQPEGDLPPGMPKHEQDQVLRDVAELMSKQAGQGAGGWARWAQDIISPTVDPKALLVAAVRRAVDQTSGAMTIPATGGHRGAQASVERSGRAA